VVADPSGSAEPRRYALDGNFEPEAFSTDDADLFLIQHLPAMQPTVYRVTRLDLATGRVRPVPGPFKVPPERMPGTRLQQLASPLGTQLYTLYSSARPGYAPHGAPVSSDAVVSFVHVLDLEYGWAHCVGLPEAMWDRPSSAQALATTPDGRLLYAVDPGLGLVAAMNTRTLRVSTGTFPGVAGSTGRTSVETSADGSTLFVATASNGSTALTLVDASTFEVRGRRELAGEVTDLARSPDGGFVFAATSGHVVVLDGRTGRPLGTVELDAPGDVTSVTALAA
jgi:outer membrane protein assembly factor BamB